MKTFSEWLQEFPFHEAIARITPRDLEKRLEAIGWRIRSGRSNESHRIAQAPDGIGSTTWTVNKVNWEKYLPQIAGHIFKDSISPTSGYEDLGFVFQNPFVIPANFNIKTQRIEEPSNIKKVMIAQIARTNGLESLIGQEMAHGNQWKKIAEIGYGNDGRTVEIMFDDSSVVTMNSLERINVRSAENSYAVV